MPGTPLVIGPLSDAFGRRRNAHAREQRDGPLARLFAAERLVRAHRFHDLHAHREHGVERGHRLLEDHSDTLAPHGAHGPLVCMGQVLACEHD